MPKIKKTLIKGGGVLAKGLKKIIDVAADSTAKGLNKGLAKVDAHAKRVRAKRKKLK